MPGDSLQRSGGEPTEPMFEIVHEPRSGTRILRLTGDLDETAASKLRLLAGEFLSSAPRLVLVDLSTVTTMTTAGVEALVHIAESAGEDDIGLGLVTRVQVRAALVAEQVDELFELYDSLDDALDAPR